MSGVSNLAQGTWADAEAMVGETIAVLEGADAATIPDMRRKLEVLGWDCPLHTDAEVARAHGYDDVIAPASMARVWAMTAYWQPPQPRLGTEQMSTPIPATMVPGEGDVMIATSARMEYHEPVYAGDRITATAVLKSVTRKTTRHGPGAFLAVEATYRKQDGTVVAVETVSLLRYMQRDEEDAS